MRGLVVSAVVLGLAASCVGALGRDASAQKPPPAAVPRAVISQAKLPSVVAAPLYFRLVRVTLPAQQTSAFEGANGIIYQLSGSTVISVNGGSKTLAPGEGVFLPRGTTAALQAQGDTPSVFLHFLLATSTNLDQPAELPPAVVEELYRAAAPIPGLKGGTYDLNLTRITFPAQMPSNAPHHRSGAALYYLLSGTGANTINGKVVTRPPGSTVYEPFDLVHQWGNPGAVPLTFLTFNINPEGTPAVLPVVPKTSQ